MSGDQKKLRSIQRSTGSHWVGNGFPVRTLFAYPNMGGALSPFLLFDYAGPREFEPTQQRRGVGEHPHRGFETVTIVYRGEVEHRDSSGGGGVIAAGDVQWMTAASGVVHEEFHSEAFAKRGGMFEVVQLWVNLPTQYKMSPPRYQAILDQDIPAVALPGGAGTLRVIAGAFDGAKGPTKTFTPIHLWDMKLNAGSQFHLDLIDGYTTALAVLQGSLCVNGCDAIEAAEVGLFDRSGARIEIDCKSDTTALLLCGEPIDEPIAGQGPFVMNTGHEIQQAIVDYQQGKMGQLPENH